MFKYTTGELAKLCGVSVRTVQYYDSRNILNPSELSEGGRRLYSDADLQQMRTICFLREMGFSIDSIGQMLSEGKTDTLIATMIEEQETALSRELEEQRARLNTLADLRRAVRGLDCVTVETLGDAAQILKNRGKRKGLLLRMLLCGLLMDLIQVACLITCFLTQNWWFLLVAVPPVVALGVWISYFYYSHTDYLCPACHRSFHPGMRAAFFAAHTPNTRRLSCTHCGHQGFCAEIWRDHGNS